MPYSRRRGAPIKTDKHEITWSSLAADVGTADLVIPLATGVASANKDASAEVEVGSHVRSVYFEMNMAAETITNPKVLHWLVIVRPAGSTPTSITPTLYYQNGRNLVIKRGMEMLPKDVSTVYKRVFVVRVPRKAQRFGADDKMSLVFRATSTETINVCGFAIYKEIY